MGSEERKIRAIERRRKAVITRVGPFDGHFDDDTLRGTEAMALAWQLSREAWSFSGRAWPDYDRSSTPLRFIRE